MAKLAAVEATQSIEVLFALIGEIFFLSAPIPTPISLLGMALVIGGMVLHSYVPRTGQLEVSPQANPPKQFSKNSRENKEANQKLEGFFTSNS